MILHDQSSHTDDLPRGLGLSTTTYVVIASIVGTGILTTSGYITRDVGSHTIMLALWLVGGLLAMCGALTVAEMAAAMPHAGGEYVYMREAYGKLPAFIYGWITFFIGFSAPTALAAHAAARYCIDPFRPHDLAAAEMATRLLAAVVIVIMAAVHLRGQSLGARTQNITTLAKLAVLVALIIGGLAVAARTLPLPGDDLPEDGVPWRAVGISLVYVMFSYTGWNAATYLAGEVKDARRLLPRSLLLGCGSVILLYLLLNLVYACALPASELRLMPDEQVEPIAGLSAERLFGRWVSAPLSVAIGVGLFATVSAFVLTGPRVYYAMARDGLFPAAAGRLNPKTRTPAIAVFAQAVCTLVMLFSGGFRSILTYAGVGLSLSSFFVILAVFVLRIRRPDMHRPFKTPGYPFVPIVFLVCTAWMIVFAFQSEPRWSTVSLSSILAGVPVYYLWRAIVGDAARPIADDRDAGAA